MPGQVDLEIVVALPDGAVEQHVGRLGEGGGGRRPAQQHRLRLALAPRLMCDAAQGNAYVRDARVRGGVIEPHRHRGGHQREGVGQAVAHLEVGVVAGEALGRQVDGGHEFAAAERGVAPGFLARQAVILRHGDDALAAWTRHPHLRVERRQRHAHVGWMRRDAVLARAQDRVDPVDAADGAAARARRALVAGRGGVVKVIAARPLVEVAAVGRGVAELRAGAGQDRARQQRVTLGDPGIVGGVGVGRQRAQREAAIGALGDVCQGQRVDVDEPRRALHVVLHQVDEVGSARDEAGAAFGAVQHRRVHRARAQDIERPQARVSCPGGVRSSTSITASAMLA